jgi:hypothetical protein
METPDELLVRLDRMGEERVRTLLGRDYFEPKAVSLVRGWLERAEQVHSGNGRAMDGPALLESLEKARRGARQAWEAAEKADATARKAQRMALIATTVGSAAMLVAVLALFALALR